MKYSAYMDGESEREGIQVYVHPFPYIRSLVPEHHGIEEDDWHHIF